MRKFIFTEAGILDLQMRGTGLAILPCSLERALLEVVAGAVYTAKVETLNATGYMPDPLRVSSDGLEQGVVLK